MRQIDLKQLAAKVSVEHGIRVDPDDPMMAAVTLNRIVLEQASDEIVEKIRSALREFEQAAAGVQAQGGALLAHRVRECAAALRQELVESIGNGTAQTQAQEKPHVQRWVALGLLSAAALFGCGVWLGIMLR